MQGVVLGLLSSIAILTLTPAANAADARNGETLAKRWCADCHVVAADQRSGTTQATPFSAIADRPGFDAAMLALFLLSPHPKMPDMGLSRAEAADLVAYIATQGGR
ncbi:MAG: cytochrome c [Pseudolabrys sp.]|nr:cytochrome c [Pseudolabrys sp.]